MKRIKWSALILGFLVNILTAIVGAIVFFGPLVLLMMLFGTHTHQIVDRLLMSFLGQLAGVVLVLLTALVTGYVIARVAKNAPFFNITIYLLIPFVLQFLRMLLNAPSTEPISHGWLLTFGNFLYYPAIYIGGMFVDRRRQY